VASGEEPELTFWVTVDGLVLPAQVAGHPALEFCNTWAGWNGGHAGDYLKTFDHLAVWAGWQGLLEDTTVRAVRRVAGRRPRQAAAGLARARSLRRALYSVAIRRGNQDDWVVVSREAERAAASARFVRSGSGGAWDMNSVRQVDLPVLAAARAAAELLSSDLIELVASCPGSGCGWLFLDVRGRRKWCSMQSCGNRDKVRRFAARHRVAAR
jgi:predicted RNA-binding Zn ribbon-like protein